MNDGRNRGNTDRDLNAKHIEWIDVARAFAICCVVLCHSVEKTYPLHIDYIPRISMQSRIFCFLAFTVGRCGVPIFLMISGYLLLDRTYDGEQCRKFWRNNWLRLLVCYELWNVIYNFYLCSLHQEKFSIIFLLQEVLFVRQISLNHIWYLPMIIGLYLLVPFVANGLCSLDYKLLRLPIVIMFMAVMVFPVIEIIMKGVGMETLSIKLSDGFSGGVNGLYLILGFLIKKGMLKKYRVYCIGLMGVAAFLLTVKLQLWSYQHGNAYNVWYNCGLLVICTVCIFEMFSRIRITRCCKLIKVVSYYSFAIYLIHNMMLREISSMIQQIKLLQPVRVVLLWIGSLILSIFCAAIINRIPKVGKLLLYTKN